MGCSSVHKPTPHNIYSIKSQYQSLSQITMAVAMALTVAQTLFAALDSSILKDMCSMFGYKSQLEELKLTVKSIKAVLRDAEVKQEAQELTYEARDWVEKLKDVLYDADDLIDEFNTLAKQQQKDMAKGKDKLLKKVQRFFSRSNKLFTAVGTSLDIKKLNQKLDAIARDHQKYGLSINYEHIRKPREETVSDVNKDKIIGRDADKETIVDLLLRDSNAQEKVSFVTIVGIGGLGKTALAQMVYNDDKIISAFQLRLWVCVSEEFGVKEILSKMLMSIGQKCDGLVPDQLLKKVREHIQGKKFLLVLDDVWAEDRSVWVGVKDLLIGGNGSKIVVTSRSKLVARAIGLEYHVHELQGLSEDDSWCLFKQMAFEQSQEPIDPILGEMGKHIVKKCASVPLYIRVIGSLLYGQDKNWWMAFKNSDNLPKIKERKDDPLAVLRFSYHHLSHSLKSCFSYCSLFPKDHMMFKDNLISLWLAYDCIEPLFEGQSLIDAGHEYFAILLNRCFFQDIRKNEYGEISSCKIHDLMHDLAQEVAGNDSLILSSSNPLDRNIRHLSIVEAKSTGLFSPGNRLAEMKTMRTFLQMGTNIFSKLVCPTTVPIMVSSCIHLRVLDLKSSLDTTLPNSIGKLVHLRYLDLSYNQNIEWLPESITNLLNLQVLKLTFCSKLKRLPKELSKLVNLSHLDIGHCRELTHMPGGMSKLSHLHTLTDFIVSETDNKQVETSQLEDLKALVNLKGDLSIKVKKICAKDVSKVREGQYLVNKRDLKGLCISFSNGILGDVQEDMLEGFRPNLDLRGIEIEHCDVLQWPSWANALQTSVPNLVRVKFCVSSVLHLPSLSQLRHLRFLEISVMDNVEYMEMSESSADTTTSAAMVEKEVTFFPSLEEIRFGIVPALKRWWGRSCNIKRNADLEASSSNTGAKEAGLGLNNYTNMPIPLVSFPRLRRLTVNNCRRMTLFPPCPKLEDLSLTFFNNALSFKEKMIENESNNTGVETTMATGTESFVLKKLESDVLFFNRLPEESVRALVDIKITGSSGMTMPTLRRCASSLQRLQILSFGNLKSLSGGVLDLEYLTNLQSLNIGYCSNLVLEEDDNNDEGILQQPWKSLQTSLISLELWSLRKLVNLANWIQYFTSLQSLYIMFCDNFISLPECLGCLTSLRSLELVRCPELQSLPEAMRHLTSLVYLRIQCCDLLTERCRAPDGKDWPKICHIPNLKLD